MSNNQASFVQTQQNQQRPIYDSKAIHVRALHGYDFYRKFLGFMTPLHNMRRADLNIMAHILLRREEISKTCEDQSVIDELLFSTEERRRICERVGCKLTRLKQSLAQLRKCGAIINNAVNPKIIPQFAKGGDYLLIIHFDFNADD